MDSATQSTERSGLKAVWASLVRRVLHGLLPVTCDACGVALAGSDSKVTSEWRALVDAMPGFAVH